MKTRNKALWPIVIVLGTLMPVLLLHRHHVGRKWDVVVFWTVVTFVPVIKMSQRRWANASFWGEISLLFLLHLALLIALFNEIGQGARVPLIFALPAAWLEISGILKMLNVREKTTRPK